MRLITPVERKPTPLSNRFYTPAEYLGVSQRTAWALVAKGEIAKVQIGRAVRIPRESAEAFVARGGTRL